MPEYDDVFARATGVSGADIRQDRHGDRMTRADTQRAGIFNPAQQLDLPALPPHMSGRWANFRLPNGEIDFRNIDMYLRMGYRPARPVELPPGFIYRRSRLPDDPFECVTVGELVLMVTHKDLADESRKVQEGGVHDAVASAGEMQGVVGRGPQLPTTMQDRGSSTRYGVRRPR